MTEPNKQLSQYDKLKGMLRSDIVQKQFADVLGERAPQFLASILSAVASDDNLKDCEPGSILMAALQAAVLDLTINRNLGFAWIIAYRDNKANVKRANFQVGYKGYIQLAIRTGQYQAINAAEIYEGEEVKVNRLTGAVTLNGHRTGDKVKGYAAYFRLLNGFEKFVYRTIEEIEAHKLRYAKGYDRPDSAWKTSPHEMGKKTVLDELLSKYGILSIQMQKAIQIERTVSITDSSPLPELSTIDARFAELPAETGVQSEPEPEQPEAPPAEPPARMDWAHYLVSSQAAPTRADAEKMAKLLKLNDNMTLEQADDLATLYNGWISATGCKPEQAAKMALEGRQPA